MNIWAIKPPVLRAEQDSDHRHHTLVMPELSANELIGYEHIHQFWGRPCKVTQQAWLKYRIEDAEDMRGYMYLYAAVASDFGNDRRDAAALLKGKTESPAVWSESDCALSKRESEQMKASGTPPGDARE